MVPFAIFAFSFCICSAQRLEISADVVARASPNLIGLGIEDVNHELYGGLYSQMVYGEDFEEPAGHSGVSGDIPAAAHGHVSPTWSVVPPDSPGAALPSYEVIVSNAFNGQQAQLLMAQAGSPARILNRGLYQQGLYLQEGREYEGYLFARLSQAEPPTSAARLNVSLVSGSDENEALQMLDAVSFEITSSSWTRINFTLIPRSSAGCRTQAYKAGNCQRTTEGECVRCEGGLLISALHGAVAVDFVFLQPGVWGRFHGLPVRRDVGELLQDMGLGALRLGGSMCNVEGYRWKNMRGPREHRQPYTGTWHPYASQGWRIFEFLQLCEILGVQAIVTLNSDEAVEDLADLVEYAFGAADTTWGSCRVQDGRTARYRPFIVEIGNEQGLDYQLIRAVADGAEAMRVRAGVVGMEPGLLNFAIGHNLDMALINTPVCDAMVNATKFLGEAVMWDFHVDGQSAGQVDHWNSAFAMAEAMLDRLGSKMRIAVFEENADTHDMIRGLNRARFANSYARLGQRFTAATTANGLQVFLANDNGWDQGAVFMTPDQVWLSPYGYVDWLVSRSSEPIVLRTNLSGHVPEMMDVLASRSEDGERLALRVVNYDGETASALDLLLPHGTMCKEVSVSQLRVPPGLEPRAVNPPSNATRIAPVTQNSSWMLHPEFPPSSLTAVMWSACRGASGAIFV